MNQYFFDHLSCGVILVENGTITHFNQPAQSLFPQLGQEEEHGQNSWLHDCFPLAKGTFEKNGTIYQYSVVPQDKATLYLLDPVSDAPLNNGQLDALLFHIRENLSSIYSIMDSFDLDDQVYAPMHQKVMRLLRLVNNCDLAMGEGVRDCLEVFDLAGLLRQLSGEIPTVLPQADIQLSLPLSLLVEANMKYLRKAILGLCANSFAQGNQLQFKLTSGKTQALLEIRDGNSLKTDVSSVMTGRSNAMMPSLQGAGFGMMAVQQTLRSFHCNLWAEESQDGGLVLTLSIPLYKKKAKTVDYPQETMILDKEAGWNDLLLELSPVLKADLYKKDSIDKYEG